MQSAISLLNGKSGTAQDKEVFQPATKIAPNSNHIQQLRFFSTKKKRETHERDGQNQQQMKKQQKTKMAKTAIKVCGVCWQEDDEKNSGSNVKFVVYGFMSHAMVIITMTRIYVALV